MRAGMLFWAGALAVWSTGAMAADPEIGPFVAREISPRVHLLSTPQDYYGPVVGNVSIIEQNDGFIVVDTGLTVGNGRSIVDYIRARSAKPVKAVIFSHWHNDHPQGASAIRDAWPKVRIIATPQTKAGLLGPARVGVDLKWDDRLYPEMQKQIAETKRGHQALLDAPDTPPDRKERLRQGLVELDRFMAGYRGTYIVLPTETFTSERLIDDPVTPVELLYFGRANTAGDAIVWLPKQKIAMSGDVVVWPIPFGFFSYPAEWIQTLSKLKALRYSILIPGHGEPQSDARYIDQLIALISDVRAQVGPLAKQGLPLDEVRKKVDFSKHADLFATQPRLKPQFQQYWVEPMVENAWKEANGITITQGDGEVQAKPGAKKSK